MFARWAERFHAQMAQMRAQDDATLADALAQAARPWRHGAASTSWLAGFATRRHNRNG